MADNNNSPSTYDGIFTILAFLILAATVLVAIGGIYYNFINPAF
jgi:hypothetical protein